MKVFYSTSEGYEAIQNNPSNSVGGYPSITPVSNGRLNSLFSDVSGMAFNNQEPQYIGLFLKNITANTISGATLWLELPQTPLICYSAFEVAVVVPELDTEYNPYIERLSDLHSMPFIGDFYSIASETDALTLPDILAGGYLGIWIKRTVLKQAAINEYNASITQVGNIYQQAALGTEDVIALKVSWT
jgi:hypothetical protein